MNMRVFTGLLAVAVLSIAPLWAFNAWLGFSLAGWLPWSLVIWFLAFVWGTNAPPAASVRPRRAASTQYRAPAPRFRCWTCGGERDAAERACAYCVGTSGGN